MISGKPKITTMLIVFALILYGGALFVTIHTDTRERQVENNYLAAEAARLEIEVAELEFAIGRYMAYVNAGLKLEELRILYAETEDLIELLQKELARPGSTIVAGPGEDIDSLIKTRDEIEREILMAEVELIHLQMELDNATDVFNAVDVSNVIAEIARTHLGLELPDEIILHGR